MNLSLSNVSVLWLKVLSSYLVSIENSVLSWIKKVFLYPRTGIPCTKPCSAQMIRSLVKTRKPEFKKLATAKAFSSFMSSKHIMDVGLRKFTFDVASRYPSKSVWF